MRLFRSIKAVAMAHRSEQASTGDNNGGRTTIGCMDERCNEITVVQVRQRKNAAQLEESLREDVLRYEPDLRELART